MQWFKKVPSRIYLDYASATPCIPEALEAMRTAESRFANPGGLHADAVAAKKVLENARERIAAQLGCKARQLVLTSSLTESNNLAILGSARKLLLNGKSLGGTHWITAVIEHSSVLECFSVIEQMGGDVTHLEPDERGRISSEALSRALRPETVFISIGWANSEIGVVQPLREYAAAIREGKSGALLHSDAGQAPLYLHPQVHTLGVDLLSIGSSKVYGPRTVGALFASDPSVLAPVIIGGGQEYGLRAGTETPVPAAGFAIALEVAAQLRGREAKRLRRLRDEFARHISERIPEVVLNTDLKHSLPHMLNISVPGERTGEYLALALDRRGISVSTKSACDEGNRASHVVEALGGPLWRPVNTLRFSLGTDTTARDLNFALQALVEVAARS